MCTSPQHSRTADGEKQTPPPRNWFLFFVWMLILGAFLWWAVKSPALATRSVQLVMGLVAVAADNAVPLHRRLVEHTGESPAPKNQPNAVWLLLFDALDARAPAGRAQGGCLALPGNSRTARQDDERDSTK